MCSLVIIMCVGLVLLETRAVIGLVLPKTGHTCDQQCLLHCQRLVAEHLHSGGLWCNCQYLCEQLCQIHIKQETKDTNVLESNLRLPEIKTTVPFDSPRIPCTIDDCSLPSSTWEHLLTFCQHYRTKRKPRSPMLRDAALIARSVGLDIDEPVEVTGEESFSNVRDENTIHEMKRVWNLRLMRISRGQEAVTTQVAWDYLPSSWYLVTWELEGGGLRGNLFTNNTTTSLTLWPDMVYHVQISALNTGDTSECLVVDLETYTPSDSQSPYTVTDVETVAGALAAVAVFLTIIIIILARRCNDKSHSKEIDKHQDYTHFKLYPPPITLTRSLLEPTSPQLCP